MENTPNFLLQSGFYDELSVRLHAQAVRRERQGTQEISYPGVDFSSNYYETGLKEAEKKGGIVAYATDKPMHYGNPFIIRNGGEITFAGKGITTVREAVLAYRDWLAGAEQYRGIEPERRQWIVDRIFSGELYGKPVYDLTEALPEQNGGYHGYKKYARPFAPSSAMVLQDFINRPEELAAAINSEQRVHLEIANKPLSAERLPYNKVEVRELLKWVRERPDELKENLLIDAGDGDGVSYIDEWFNTLSPEARQELFSPGSMRLISKVLASAKVGIVARDAVDLIRENVYKAINSGMDGEELSAYMLDQYGKMPAEAKITLAHFMRLYVGLEHERGITKMDLWFSGLSAAEKTLIMNPATINMVSRFDGMAEKAEDCKKAMDDIMNNFQPDWESSFTSEAKKDSFLNEVFYGFPASVRNAIYSKMSSESYRKNLSASYEFIMVGTGKRSFNEVMACVPKGVTLVVDVRSSTATAVDARLQKANIGKELMGRNIKYMHVPELSYRTKAETMDLDAYSASPEIREKLDLIESLLTDENGHKRQIVLLTNETEAAKGVCATGLGQALERDGKNVVYNSLYSGSLKSFSRTHAQVISSILGNYVLDNGRVSQIHFYNTGKYYTDEGVVIREHVVAQADRRIRGRDNYDNPVKMMAVPGSHPLTATKQICRRASSDVVFIASFGETDVMKSEAAKAAGDRKVSISLRPDPQLLESKEYAERKAAECFADYQGILDSCIRNNPRIQKISTPMVLDYAHLREDQKEIEYDKANRMLGVLMSNGTLDIPEGKDMQEYIARVCYERGIIVGTYPREVVNGQMPEDVSWENVSEETWKAYHDYAGVITSYLEGFGLKLLYNGDFIDEELVEGVAKAGHDYWSAKLKEAGCVYGPKPEVVVDVKAAFVGSFEAAMMTEKVKKAATDYELAMLEKSEAIENEGGFALSESMMDDRSRYSGTSSSGRVSINAVGMEPESQMDMMKMTGVTEETMQVFFKNFFEAVERGVSFASLYTDDQLSIDEEEHVSEYQVERERRKIAGRVYKNAGLQRTMKDARDAYDECQGVEKAYQKDGELDETFNEFKTRFYGGEDSVPTHVRVYEKGQRFRDFSLHYFTTDNKDRETFIENYDIVPVSSRIKECISLCNPGLQRAALLAAQEMNRDAVAALPSVQHTNSDGTVMDEIRWEATAFISTVRNGVPVNWTVREGRKSRVDNKNHVIYLAPGQMEAYLLNPFHAGIGMSKGASEKESMEARSRRLYAEQYSTDRQPGLSPIQMRVLSQKLHFPPAVIREMNHYLVSIGSAIHSPESFAGFIYECGNSLQIYRKASELELDKIYSALEEVSKESAEDIERGIGAVSILSDLFPAPLKGWDGYEKLDKVYTEKREVDFVFVEDGKGHLLEGEQIDEKVIKEYSRENDEAAGVAHVEYDTGSESPAKGKKKEVPVMSHHEHSPSFIHYKGDLSVFDRPTITLFGDGSTETPTHDMRSATLRVADELVSKGVTIVSVLRPGTNFIAIKEAVDRGGRVIAVLPEGFRRTQYNSIIEDIVRNGGCVISEVAPGDSRGMLYNAALVQERAERMASVIGKHVVILDAKHEHGTGEAPAYQGVCDEATNGVSVLSYKRMETVADRMRVGGNEKLLKEREGVQEIASDTLEGLSESVRLAWAVSPIQREEEAVEHMDSVLDAARRIERPKTVSVDKLPFYVVRNGTQQFFVVKEMYADVRDTVRKTYGDGVEFVNTLEEAEGRLYGNSVEVMGERVDTFTGWKGTEPLVPRPYKVPLVYYKDVIYTPTNAPEAAVGVQDEIRTQHRIYFNKIAQEATFIQAKMNELLLIPEKSQSESEEAYEKRKELAKECLNQPLRIANSRYLVTTPMEVVLYEGMGEDAEEDRVVSKISLGQNGLLQVHNNFFSIENGEEGAIRQFRGKRDQISDAQVNDIITDLNAAIFEYSRRQSEMYMLSSREENDELDKNFESGFYKLREAAIDEASVFPYLGTTLFEPALDQKGVITKEEAVMYINLEVKDLEARYKKLTKSLEKAEQALYDKTGELEGTEHIEEDQYAEKSDNIQTIQQDISIFTEDRGKIAERLAELEVAKTRLALGDKVFLSAADPNAHTITLTVGGNGIVINEKHLPEKKKEPAIQAAAKEIEDIRQKDAAERKAMEEVVKRIEGPSRSVNRMEIEGMLKERRKQKLMDPSVYEEEVVKTLKSGKKIIKREGLYAIVDKDLTFMSNPPVYYKMMEPMGSSQRLLVQKENGRFNVINGIGKELFESDYNVIREGKEHVGEVYDGKKWCFIDWKKGAVPLSEGAYEEVRSFKEGFAAVRIGSLWTFVEHPEVSHKDIDKGDALRRESDASEGKPFTVFYDEVRDFSEGVAAVYVKGKGWNLIDKDDNLFLDPDELLFSEVADFHDGKAVGLINGEVVALDYNGERVDAGAQAQKKGEEQEEDASFNDGRS